MEDRTKRRARLILIVGVVLALLSGLLTFVFAQGSRSNVTAPTPTTEVLVAAREIPGRTVIAAADLRAVQMNTDVVPSGALRNPADVVGKVNTIPMSTGEVVLAGKFAAAQGAPFSVFPANVAVAAGAPNYRAMSLTVADQFAVGGVLQVGDVVDIMYTLNFDPAKFLLPQPGIVPGSPQDPRTADFSAKIVIERVPIIARTLQVYTIRTESATAERLAYLQAAGATLQMLLRAPQDDRAAGTQGATFGPVYEAFDFRVPTRISP